MFVCWFLDKDMHKMPRLYPPAQIPVPKSILRENILPVQILEKIID